MAFFVSAPSNDGPYELCPEGPTRGLCVGIYDLGTQTTVDWGLKHKVMFMFETSDEVRTDAKPFILDRSFNVTLGKDSGLLNFIQGWLGSAFKLTDRFDLCSLLGKAGTINVTHSKGSGANAEKIYANIGNVAPLMKGMAIPEPVTPIRQYSIKEDGENIPAGTPEKIIKRIMSSTEMAGHVMATATTTDSHDDIPY